jgi:hypothetical protein
MTSPHKPWPHKPWRPDSVWVPYFNNDDDLQPYFRLTETNVFVWLGPYESAKCIGSMFKSVARVANPAWPLYELIYTAEVDQ